MRRGDAQPAAPLVATLEAEVLPQWLTRRRWFASKDRSLDAARFDCVTSIPGEPFQYAEVVASSDGREERYVVPLAAAWGDETPHPLFMQLALARVRRGPTVGYLTDAFALPGFAHGVLAKLAEHASVPLTSGGTLVFSPEPTLAEVMPTLGPTPGIRWLAAEQSNSSLVIGETLVLKLVRRVAAGIHPEAEMSRHLTRAGYANAPALAGEVLRVGADGTPHTVAILQGFVDNQGDAWDRSLDFLKRAVGDLALSASATPDAREADGEADEIDAYAEFAGAIGTRLGELHVTLAAPTDDPAFAPERATPAHVARWTQDAIAMVDRAMGLLAPRLDDLDDGVRDAALALLASREDLVAALDPLLPEHLDALLHAYPRRFPSGPGARRAGRRDADRLRGRAGARAGRTPRQIASLARRGGPAALALLCQRGRAVLDREGPRSPPPTASARCSTASGRPPPTASSPTTGAPSSSRPRRSPGPRDAERLLTLFLVEKAAYELAYEAANRPDWLGVPVLGLAALSAQLLGRDRGPDEDDPSSESHSPDELPPENPQ